MKMQLLFSLAFVVILSIGWQRYYSPSKLQKAKVQEVKVQEVVASNNARKKSHLNTAKKTQASDANVTNLKHDTANVLQKEKTKENLSDEVAPVFAQQKGDASSYTLANGLKVLVIENHRTPIVVSQLWYKVGASYEHDGITGISHVLEHLMFKGTPKHPAGKFSEIIAFNGGEENAFTGQDFTAYFQKIVNNKLALCLELEADRMRNLLLDKKEFLKELEVVKEERRLRTDDKPTALTYERFNASAYTNSPYRRPSIGWMEDLDNLTIEDLASWYKTWYAPNNATLVIAGDVDAKAVFELAKQKFGALEKSTIPALKPQREAEQFGTKRITVELPAKVPYLVMGYKAPVISQVKEKWEVYALEVLAGVLDGGDSARLSKNLVRGAELATSAGASYGMTSAHETLFVLSGVPVQKVAISALESALKKQVAAIKLKIPDEVELERVKAQVVASKIYQQDSVFYQAMEVGMLETVGLPWQLKNEYTDKIMAVTAAQVQQVAKKYLIDKNLTIATLKPLAIITKQNTKQNKVPLTNNQNNTKGSDNAK